jgi:hypothetical protein
MVYQGNFKAGREMIKDPEMAIEVGKEMNTFSGSLGYSVLPGRGHCWTFRQRYYRHC